MSVQPEYSEYRPELDFDLPDRLRKSLRVADLSVQTMADYLEVNRITISRWINGRTAPTAAAVRLWALRTGVPYRWLRDGENPRPGDPSGGEVLPRLDLNQRPSDYMSSLVGEVPDNVVQGPWPAPTAVPA